MCIFENASDWDQARCCSSIRLEMRANRIGRSIFAHAETEKKSPFNPMCHLLLFSLPLYKYFFAFFFHHAEKKLFKAYLADSPNLNPMEKV